MEMKQQILDYVREHKNVTFAELTDRIDGFSGEHALELNGPEASNIFIWAGLSDEAVKAINELRVDQTVMPRPTNVLTYVADGHVLKYPLAESVRHYKTPRWLPVVLVPS